MEDYRIDGGAEIDPTEGGAGVTSGPSGSGPSSAKSATVDMSTTAARRRTPGRWRRIPRAIVPQQNTLPEEMELPKVIREALPPPLPAEIWRAIPEEARKSREEVVKATCARFMDMMKFEGETVGLVHRTRPTGLGLLHETRADQGGLPLTGPIPPIHVMREGSRECKEAEEESNRILLEQARLLEEEDENLCDTEEDKIAFRAFKVKFAAFYRSLATTKPLFIYDPPSDNS